MFMIYNIHILIIKMSNHMSLNIFYHVILHYIVSNIYKIKSTNLNLIFGHINLKNVTLIR